MEHRVKRQIYSKSLAQQNVRSLSLKVDYLFRNTSDEAQVMITKKKSDAKSALKFCLYCKTTEQTYSKQKLQCNEGRGKQRSVCCPEPSNISLHVHKGEPLQRVCVSIPLTKTR